MKPAVVGLRITRRGIAMELLWYKCAYAEWCLLAEVDLDLLHDYGVFVIWRNGKESQVPVVLFVGHGDLRYEIGRCRNDPLFEGSYGLRITWAKVADLRQIRGVAAYLYHRLRPLWGEVVVYAPLQPVNLPLTA
jgi:hypothetical protein